jgi:hypothetical protein
MILKTENHIYFFLLAFLLLFTIPDSKAQNAPVTTAVTINGAVPGTIMVPLTVTNFNNIGAVSLSLDYNYSVLHFVQGTPNPLLSSFAIGDQDLGTGYHRITMGWFGSGVSLANGSAIMTIDFTYLDGTSTLEWFDNGPSCEYADDNYNLLNDIPQSTYYINGNICGNIANPGPITGDNSVCRGQQGVIYSIAPVSNATGYGWTVPGGAAIVNGGNTNSIMVDYSTAAVSGNVTVYGLNDCGNGPVSLLPVTVNALPVANAGNDFSIPYGTTTTLYAASGGSGSYSYHWSPESLLVNPDVQNPQTVNLYSTTIFTLLVTNQASQCLDSDEVIVTITGGPLSINPVAVPNTICVGQGSQLYSNAGGGSANYTYQWTSNPAGTPPWTSVLANPQVIPGVTTQYLLSVWDGFNTVSGSTEVTVNLLPAAAISGGDSLCDDGSTTTLGIDLTGVPPWAFVYTDGINSFSISGQMTTPYLIETSDPGIYTVLFVQDANCTGVTYGSATVSIFPVPETPVIVQNDLQLISSSCCGNQWYLDGEFIPGATSQFYTPTVIGSYFDIVTLNGCMSDTSNSIIVTVINVDQKEPVHICLYPNPAIELVKFRCPLPDCRGSNIQIMNPYGLIVKEFLRDDRCYGNERQLYIGDIAPGFYFVKITFENGTFLSKLVIE